MVGREKGSLVQGSVHRGIACPCVGLCGEIKVTIDIVAFPVVSVYPVPLLSANINVVGYDGDTLYIRFHHGGTYRYEAVPASVFEALVAAESAGKFFSQFIKGKYAYARLNQDPFVAAPLAA